MGGVGGGGCMGTPVSSRTMIFPAISVFRLLLTYRHSRLLHGRVRPETTHFQRPRICYKWVPIPFGHAHTRAIGLIMCIQLPCRYHAGCLDGWMVLLPCWLAGWLAGLVGWLVGWLVVTGWLTDWLTDWLHAVLTQKAYIKHRSIKLTNHWEKLLDQFAMDLNHLIKPVKEPHAATMCHPEGE